MISRELRRSPVLDLVKVSTSMFRGDKGRPSYPILSVELHGDRGKFRPAHECLTQRVYAVLDVHVVGVHVWLIDTVVVYMQRLTNHVLLDCKYF